MWLPQLGISESCIDVIIEEDEQYFISITKNITSYERTFYEYVTDMLQLVIEGDLKTRVYVCKQYHPVR